MLELLIIALSVLTFIYSFIYRRVSIFIVIFIILCTYIIEANLYLIVGLISILTLIRLKLHGIKEEY